MRKYIISILLFLSLASQGQWTQHNSVFTGTYPTTNGQTVTGIRFNWLEYNGAVNTNGRKNALIIFLHGIDHRGATPVSPSDYGTLNIIKNKGIPLQLVSGGLPKMTIPGGTSPQDDIGFDLVAPQCGTQFNTWPLAYVIEILIRAKSTMTNVDFTRVYLVGYSLGGGGALGTIGNSTINPQLAWVGAQAPGYQGSTNYQYIADSGLPVTVFATVNDPLARIAIADTWVRSVNAENPVTPLQYIRFNDLPTTLGGSTQHDRIWPVVNNLTPGTSYSLTNGDAWLQTTMLKRALSFTTKRYHR